LATIVLVCLSYFIKPFLLHSEDTLSSHKIEQMFSSPKRRKFYTLSVRPYIYIVHSTDNPHQDNGKDIQEEEVLFKEEEVQKGSHTAVTKKVCGLHEEAD